MSKVNNETPTEKLKITKDPYLDLKELKSETYQDIEYNIFILSSLERMSIIYVLTVIYWLSNKNIGGIYAEKLAHFLTEFTNVKSAIQYAALFRKLYNSSLISMDLDEKSGFHLISLPNKNIGVFAQKEFLKEAPGFEKYFDYISRFDINNNVELEEEEVKH